MFCELVVNVYCTSLTWTAYVGLCYPGVVCACVCQSVFITTITPETAEPIELFAIKWCCADSKRCLWLPVK